MQPSINGSPHNSPIIITGRNQLTYKTIRSFMMDFKKNIDIQEETVKTYMKKNE